MNKVRIPSAFSDQRRRWLVTHLIIVTCTFAALVYGQQTDAAVRREDHTVNLSATVRDECLVVLRQGLRSDEFWPSIHAAEGLIRAGYHQEVASYLASKLEGETDDQKRCGLARELVRAGHWEHASVMFSILRSNHAYGHVHAAESLYKVAEIGDGAVLRKAMQQTQNPKLQLMAAAALGRCGNP